MFTCEGIISAAVLVPPSLCRLLYNATYIHISVNSVVELLSRDTALIHNHKSILFASALKPCRLNVSFTAVVRHALFF